MDTGNTGFMMVCAALVFIMTPGLAFFYGGLVRRKNVVNTMMACVAIMGLALAGRQAPIQTRSPILSMRDFR